MKFEYKPEPVLQELIEDLENKINITKSVLKDCEYASPSIIDGILKDITLLEMVRDRVIAQQELINMKAQYMLTNVPCLNQTPQEKLGEARERLYIYVY